MWTKTIAVSLLACLISVLAAAQADYTVTDLGPLSPAGINSWAQVVGNYDNQAYVWAFGRLRSLGRLSGGTFSTATSINDLGVVTGIADGPFTIIPPSDSGYSNQNCTNLPQPFVWTQKKGIQGLGTIIASLPLSLGDYEFWCEIQFEARSINIFDQIVGDGGRYSTYAWGFSWKSSTGMTAFGGTWPPTFINGINNKGEVVGQNSGPAEDSTGSSVSTIYLGHATSWTNAVPTDLGTLGGASDLGYPYGYSSSANGVNDLGQVVGYSTTTPIEAGYEDFGGWDGQAPIDALLWSASGTMTDLGTLPGDTFASASKINLFGQVIGSSGNAATPGCIEDPCGVVGRPFLWTQRSGMRDLNTLIPPNSGWVLNTATDINIWGQIVGSGTHHGQVHGFLLTPRFLW